MYVIKNVHNYVNKKTGTTGTMETYYQEHIMSGLVPVFGGTEGACKFKTRKEAEKMIKLFRGSCVVVKI